MSTSEKPIQPRDIDGLPAALPTAALADKAARRLRMARLASRIAESLDRLVRAEERARTRLGHPVWTDRLRTR